jgi:basic amino acid/polyamine antiporter, APA family
VSAEPNRRRELGLLSATALVVANMIGVGVFTTSGFLLADLGSPHAVLLVWVLGGIIAMLGALSYGSLARHIPESGGEYLFLSKTVHPAAGYMAGWISLLAGFSAPLAMAAYGFGEYLQTWFPSVSRQITGTLLILLFATVHSTHVRWGAWFQNTVVLVKLALIALFITLAFTRLPTLENVPHTPVPVSVFGVSLMWVSFSYAGWNAAIYIGGEIRNPAGNLPRSLILGTGLVTLLYLGLNAAFVFSAPIDQLAGKLDIARIASRALGGSAWSEATSFLITLALATSASSLLMAGPRICARMADDGWLPGFLRSTGAPPRSAILFQATIAWLLLWTLTYDKLLTYISFTLGISTAATVAGLILLKRREQTHLPVPGWPWVPYLFLAGVSTTTVLSIIQRPRESLIGLLTILLPFLGWFLSRPRTTSPGKQHPG